MTSPLDSYKASLDSSDSTTIKGPHGLRPGDGGRPRRRAGTHRRAPGGRRRPSPQAPARPGRGLPRRLPRRRRRRRGRRGGGRASQPGRRALRRLRRRPGPDRAPERGRPAYRRERHLQRYHRDGRGRGGRTVELHRRVRRPVRRPLRARGVEPNENGVLPLVANADCHVDGTVAGGGAAWFYDADPGDDTIQYAESMGFTTWNGAGIVGHTMRFSMDGIRTVEGEDSRTIASGDWNLKFEMNSSTRPSTSRPDRRRRGRARTSRVDAVAVSSVGVTVDYTIDRQIGDLGPSGRLSDEALAKQDAVLGLPVTVAFADGTHVRRDQRQHHRREAGRRHERRHQDGDLRPHRGRERHRERDRGRRGDPRERRVAATRAIATNHRRPPPAPMGGRRYTYIYSEDHNGALRQAESPTPPSERARRRPHHGPRDASRRPASPRRDGPAPHWR